MLQTVRRYAGEKLQAFGEDRGFRERHAEYFLRLTEESESTLRKGQEESFCLQRLETEHDNLRAALSFSLEAAGPGHGLCLAKALAAFWDVQEYFTEGRGWLEEALSEDGGEATEARATALRDLAWFAYFQGDFERSEGPARKACGSKAWRTSGMSVGSTSRPPCGRYSVR